MKRRILSAQTSDEKTSNDVSQTDTVSRANFVAVVVVVEVTGNCSCVCVEIKFKINETTITFERRFIHTGALPQRSY